MNWHAAMAKLAFGVTLLATAVSAPPASWAADLPPKPVVVTPRIYVLDCGTIAVAYPEQFNLTRDEVKDLLLPVMCFLVVHSKGVLMWDAGLPDQWVGRPLWEHSSRKGNYSLKTNTLFGQRADLGYSPAAIDYLSLSHSHNDHSGNANLFAPSATWLVSRDEWNFMFNPPDGQPRKNHEWSDGLRSAKTVFVSDNHDVFGDGSVVIRRAVGHTPGDSVLQVSLKNAGTVILAGDLYHFAEEMTLDRMPTAERSTGTPESRAKVLSLAKQTKAQIWATHDLDLYRRLTRERPFYD